MKPSNKDKMDYKLPDGTYISLWASSDTDISPWSFFWADFDTRRPPKTWYRVFPANRTPGDWQPMKPGDAVLKQTGFDDDPDLLSDPDPGGAQLGAAEKLPKGRYVLQAKIQIGSKDVELAGVTFRVKRATMRDAPNIWVQAAPDCVSVFFLSQGSRAPDPAR